MFFDRNLLIGFAAGVVVGLVGYKFVSSHKEQIESKLQGLGVGANSSDGAACEDTSSELTLEDLEAQKERLEDLIAEQKQKQNGAQG